MEGTVKTLNIKSSKQYCQFLKGIFSLTDAEVNYLSILMDIIGRKGHLDKGSRIEFCKRSGMPSSSMYVWMKKFKDKKILTGKGFNSTIANCDIFNINVEI